MFEVTLPAYPSPCPDQNVTYKIGVIVTDGHGQPTEDSTTLFVGTPSSAPFDVHAPSVAVSEGPRPVSIAASVQGGTGPYSYAWIQTAGPTVSPHRYTHLII